MAIIEKPLTFMERARVELKKKLAKGFLIHEEETDEDLIAFRQLKCQGDPKQNIPPCMWYNNRTDECKDCGCIISLKSKTRVGRNPERGTFNEMIQGGALERIHCPQGRWGDKSVANYYRSLEGRPPIT